MLYREMGRTGDKVSILGYGCMRFPREGGRIDEARTHRQIVSAIERGVNYFDTAYIYPGSEAVLGKALAQTGLRDKVMIATKMPLPLIHSVKNMQDTLHTSLERLKTDHIDYYLMHSVMSLQGWQRIQELGVEDFLAQAQKAGKIGRIGFSFHGQADHFKRMIDDYPWDFCQIQYNFMDEAYQAGTEGLRYAGEKGIGVVVMEPLRGGLLGGQAPADVQAVWDRAPVKRSPAEWSLRWIWDHPEVTTVLSGMNVEEHVDENIRTACDAVPHGLTEGERALVQEAKEVYGRLTKVGCTGCGYCMPCPAGVNIPFCFSSYNNMYMFDRRTYRTSYAGFTLGVDGSAPSYASLCRDCGKCEKHCPQSLPIRRHLKSVATEMEGFYFRSLTGLVKGYYRLRGKGKRVVK